MGITSMSKIVTQHLRDKKYLDANIHCLLIDYCLLTIQGSYFMHI